MNNEKRHGAGDRPHLPQVANITGFNDSTVVRSWMFTVDPFTFG